MSRSKGFPEAHSWRTALGVQEGVTPLLVGNRLDESNRILGGLLRSRRRAQGRSAVEVAEAAGVSASFVRSVERGDLAPSQDSLTAIAACLGIDTNAERIQLTDEESGEAYAIFPVADSKGHNTRQSLAERIGSLPEAQRWTVLASMFGEEPSIKRALQAELQRREEEQERELRARGIYGVPDGEHPEVTRSRVMRRVAVASDEQVLELSDLLDSQHVLDPQDVQPAQDAAASS